LRQHYDILALRPTDERTLQQAVLSLDCDIISLNIALRYQFHFKPKTFAPAIARGVKIELCYGASILGSDAEQRRNVLSNAAEIVRSTRGRGIIISGEAANVLGCRAPHDVVNLAVMWGLKQELGMEALGNGARSVVAAAQLRKRSFRGAVDVVQIEPGSQVKADGEADANGSKTTDTNSTALDLSTLSKKKQKQNERKRRADTESTGLDPEILTKKTKS
jgi:ribonuclease P/MRP protein subunit RPP1